MVTIGIHSKENQFTFQRSGENTPVFAVGFIVLLLVILNVVTILLKHDKEDEMRERLRLLWSYHYRGLNGVKSELGL